MKRFFIFAVLVVVVSACEEEGNYNTIESDENPAFSTIESIEEVSQAIVNGDTSIPSFLPHTSVANLHNCTGLLVSPRLVLTANHCGTPSRAQFYLNASGSQVEEVSIIGRHSWRQSDLTDLAILVLNSEPTFAQPYNSFIGPNQGSSLQGDDIYIVGRQHGSTRTHVYGEGQATTNVYRLKRFDYRFSISLDGSTSTEGGDSGAPIFDSNGNLIGVHTGSGEVYVGHTQNGEQIYVDWIEDLSLVEEWIHDNPGKDAWACFFEDSYFNGDYYCLAAGNEQSYVGSAWNDEVSSIKLFGHAQVKAFRHASFGGTSLDITEDIGWLGNYSFNDRISSTVVPPVVCFYDYSNYSDHSGTSNSVKYCTTFIDGTKMNMANVSPSLVEDGYSPHMNNKISSIEIIGDNQTDAVIDVCKDTNTDGKCLQFNNSVTLSAKTYSDGTVAYDTISSVVVSHKPYGCFYKDSGYGGKKICVAPENRDYLSWLGSYGMNDNISSFLKRSYSSTEYKSASYSHAALYEDSNWDGRSVNLTSSVYSGTSLEFGDGTKAYDKASSLYMW